MIPQQPDRRVAGPLIGNAVFILTSDVVGRAAMFVLFALIARHLGAADVGKMALALSLFYSLRVFAAAGQKSVITREVAKNTSTADHCLASGTIVVTLASALSLTALAGFVRVIGYSGDTTSIILVLGLALLPNVLSAVCESVFQGLERMRYIAYAQVPVHVAKVGLAYLLLVQGYGIYHIAILLLVSHGAVAGVEWWLMLRYVTRPRFEGFARSVQSSFAMARRGGTFLGIDGVGAISASIGVVLLSALTTERDLGLCIAAMQLTAPMGLVYQAAVLGVFPTLCRRFELGLSSVTPVLERTLTFLLALAIPTAVGLFFLADSALLLLYGDRDFLLASPVLRIVVWLLIPSALSAVLGQVFLASGREKVTLRIIAVNAVVDLVAGALFITKFGLIGAAMAAVVGSAVNLLQHLPIFKLVPTIRLHRLSWKPLVAASCMAGYLAGAPNQSVILTAAYAGTLYLGVLLVLSIWNAGVPGHLKGTSLQVGPD